MISKIQLLCVSKLDTFEGNMYEAHLHCTSKDDGLALAGFIEKREELTSIKFVGCAFKPTAKMRFNPEDKSREFILTSDVFITVRVDGEMTEAMELVAVEIDSLIR